MGLTFYDLQAMTRNWTDRAAEQRALDDLYNTAESAVKLTLTQAVYYYLGAQTAADLAVALVEANGDLEQKAQAVKKAVSEWSAIETDLAAAEAARELVGRPGHTGYRERALSSEQHKIDRLRGQMAEAGKKVREARRDHAESDRKVAGMKRVLVGLRSVHKPDPVIMRALAEALALADVEGR